MRVEVDLVLVEDLRGVPAAEDRNLVGDLFASQSHEALGVSVAVRRARRDLPDLDAFGGEDSVERPGELAVTVSVNPAVVVPFSSGRISA